MPPSLRFLCRILPVFGGRDTASPLLRFQESILGVLETAYERVPPGPGLRVTGDDCRIVQLPFIGWLDSIAGQLLGEECIRVRGIFFAKSRDSNWNVPWHQDVTLAVPRRVELEGYRSWTMKDGMWHVQPPEEVLKRMVAVRLHLDPCGTDDGPLRVWPNSHLLGRRTVLCADPEDSDAVTILVPRGGIVLMHPLTLHCSPKSSGNGKRRALHLEYCAASAYPF